MNTMQASLRLPSQAAPIDRTSSLAALNASGVDASWGFGDIWDAVKGPLTQAAQTAAGAAIPALAGMI